MNAGRSAVVSGNRNPPSHDPHSLRSKVVEILAGTANGCLAELGYYPGMPQRLQDLERQNAKWQSENVKLFQDNRNLTLALQAQNDTRYLDTIRTLESQVNGLSQENARLVKQNETLMAEQPAGYQKLASAHQRLQDFYATALHEINRLRNDIEILSGRAPAQQSYAAQVAEQEAVFKAAGSPNGQSPQVPRTIQSQIPFFSSQRTPVLPSSVAQGTPIVPSQQPGRQAFGNQVHANGQAPTPPNAQQAVSLVPDIRSHNAIPHSEHPDSQSYSRTRQSLSVSRPASSGGTSSRGSLQAPLLMDTSPVPAEPGSSHLPMTPMSSLTISPRHSAPSAPPSPSLPSANTQQAPTPTGTMNIPATAASSELSLTAQPHPSRSTSSLSGALTPRDLAVELSTSIHPEVPTEPELPSQQLPAHGVHTHPSASPAEPLEAMTPMDDMGESAPTISIAPTSTPEQEYLKRTSSAISVPDEEQQHKKQRLDEQEQPGNAEKQVTRRGEDVKDASRGEDQASEDGGVEIGSDGLRTVEDCIAALTEEDEENEELQICKLCIMRFKLGATMEEPRPFLRATTEELVQHYTSEHSAAWDQIRHNV